MNAAWLARVERAGERIRNYTFLDRPQAWRTGTSKAFWALRAAGRYEEAKALLEAKDKQNAPQDAEAYWEISQLHNNVLFGYFGDCYGMAAWRDAAYDLGHPMALIDVDCIDDATGPEADTLANYVNATGDAYAMWMCYRRRPGSSIRDDRSMELIKRGIAEGDVYLTFVGHRVGLCSLKLAADMGHTGACFQYGDEDTEYWRRGAAQGDRACTSKLLRYLPAHEAALVAVHPWQYHEASKWMRERWDQQVISSDKMRQRELFVYAYAKARWGTPYAEKPQALIIMHERICQAARDAALYFYWALRNVYCVPKDVALLIAKGVWASRATETEVWWTREIDAPLQKVGICTGYDVNDISFSAPKFRAQKRRTHDVDDVESWRQLPE